jgi:hypothetical protein
MEDGEMQVRARHPSPDDETEITDSNVVELWMGSRKSIIPMKRGNESSTTRASSGGVEHKIYMKC